MAPSSRPLWGFAAALLFSALGAAAADSSLPAYEPHPVAPPAAAGYLRSDGALQIVGFDDMQGMVERLDALFAQAHPGFTFAYAPANNLAALFSLTYDASAFAPVGTEFLAGAQGAYAIIAKGEPFGIRVAHASLNPGAKLSPLAIVVQKDNPLEHLSTSQVTRIFTVGGRQRDLTHWGQAGLEGDWTAREIHPCGLPESDHYRSEDSGFAEYLFAHKMGGAQSALNYAAFPNYADVVKAVSADPLAIGITALNRVTPDVKVVAIAANAWAAPSHGTAEDIVASRYAFDRYLYIYVRRASGKPLEPFLKEYLRLVLSREGQEAIAAESHGYLPLNATEIGEERAKLE